MGRFVAVGGPSTATPEPLRGTITFVPLPTHNPRGQTPRQVSTTTDGDGRFRAVLHVWSYVVLGRSPQYDDGRSVCRLDPRRSLQVTHAKVRHITVYCQRR